MPMKAVTQSSVNLREFLEIVLMWHCHGDIPMDRKSTSQFIEDQSFCDFLQSVLYWCEKFGVDYPNRGEIVKTLHELYC